MIRDYVDEAQFLADVKAYLAGGPEPTSVISYRSAEAGESCAGCSRPLQARQLVREAKVGALSYPHCHQCEPPPKVARIGRRSWSIG